MLRVKKFSCQKPAHTFYDSPLRLVYVLVIENDVWQPYEIAGYPYFIDAAVVCKVQGVLASMIILVTQAQTGTLS